MTAWNPQSRIFGKTTSINQYRIASPNFAIRLKWPMSTSSNGELCHIPLAYFVENEICLRNG